MAVTETSRQEIRRRYPEQPDSKFATVHNGYDPESLGGVAPRQHDSPGRMIVTHMGTAYTTASPRYYLEILDTLPEELRAHIETRFIGRVAESEASTFTACKSPVKMYGFMPQQQAWQLTAETDYLLLVMTNDFSLPGKLFEYLYFGKPILALSPPGGEVDRLLKETKAGWCADPADPEAVRAMLIRAWERLQQGGEQFQPDAAAIACYERPRLVRKLAGLLRREEGA